MAEVFLAKAAGPMGFEKTLVLKRILPDLAGDPVFVRMFLAEAKLAASLNHPNIAQIFDFGQEQGAYFIAMEYVDGPNLRSLSRRSAERSISIPVSLCAKIISSACEALAYAHEFIDPGTATHLSVIHRDVSPENILLSRTGAVKMVDFGIAKAGGRTQPTEAGILRGKISYMPPEQIQGKEIDHRADIFALGVVFYELITGSKPFDARSDVTIVQAILYEQMIPAVARRPDIPEPIARMLQRALSRRRPIHRSSILCLCAGPRKPRPVTLRLWPRPVRLSSIPPGANTFAPRRAGSSEGRWPSRRPVSSFLARGRAPVTRRSSPRLPIAVETTGRSRSPRRRARLILKSGRTPRCSWTASCSGRRRFPRSRWMRESTRCDW